jgi:hypothetical protein
MKYKRTEVMYIEIFENQRWWAGLGWISHLLRSERGDWSDRDGTIELKNKDDYSIPPIKYELIVDQQNKPLKDYNITSSWKWSGDWILDKSNPRYWSTSSKMDSQGWVYYDHNWKELPDSSYTKLTRRRRWKRQICLSE